MTCPNLDTTREWHRSTVDYLAGTVQANYDLTDQAIAVTFDEATYFDCQWVGASTNDPDAEYPYSRHWITSDVLGPTDLPDAQTCEVYARVTDDPVAAVFAVGTLTFT